MTIPVIPAAALPVVDVFVTLGIRKVNRTITVLDVATNEAECETHRTRLRIDDVRTFRVDDNLGPHLHDWCRACGMSQDESGEAVRAVGRSIREVLGEPAGKE